VDGLWVVLDVSWERIRIERLRRFWAGPSTSPLGVQDTLAWRFRQGTHMKRLVSLAILVAIAACSPQASKEDTRQAEAAARNWLTLIDAADYAQSWDTAAAYFRNSISQPQWVSRVSAIRSPLGDVKSRQESSTRVSRSLPGAPDGEYVVIQFSTSFEHKAAATETVTPMKDADGQWRVSGYYIR
jgi:Protein of unknown function (DUF4019)